MPNYTRNNVYGGTYFFTLVTEDRVPVFMDKNAMEVLMAAIKETRKRNPFELVAYCILPDHVHLIMELPADDNLFSQKVRSIKRLTTIRLRKITGIPNLTIWQNRFWEHTVRNQVDLKYCFDYVHYNPVKHGYVDECGKWAWSSFSRYYDDNPDTAKINTKAFEGKNRFYYD